MLLILKCVSNAHWWFNQKYSYGKNTIFGVLGVQLYANLNAPETHYEIYYSISQIINHKRKQMCRRRYLCFFFAKINFVLFVPLTLSCVYEISKRIGAEVYQPRSYSF